MNDVLLLAKTHVVTALRERVTLFWFLIFPVFLLTILTLIFGRLGEEGEISFEISLINRDSSSATAGDFSAMIAEVFTKMGSPHIEGQKPLFSVHVPQADDDLDTFLEREEHALRRGHRAAIVVIPEGFHDAALHAVMNPSGIAQPATLRVYMSRNDVASEMATEIITHVLAEVDREILVRTGHFDPGKAIARETVWAGQDTGEIRYVDFLLPGVVLMGFFTNGLFGVPGAILFNRDRKVLRRYWVTPLSVSRYLAGFALGHLSLCVLQLVLLLLLGRFAFGATVEFAQLDAVLILILAAVTFMAFGFLIASLARTANAGMAIANILNMPMMFLSGMFFPISGLPAFLLAVVYVNPVSYLVEGLRASLGVQSSTFPSILLVIVPLGWIAASVAVAAGKLKWDVAR